MKKGFIGRPQSVIVLFLNWVLPGVSEGGFFFHASTEIINVQCNGSSSFIKEVGRFELLPPLEIQLAASARHTPPASAGACNASTTANQSTLCLRLSLIMSGLARSRAQLSWKHRVDITESSSRCLCYYQSPLYGRVTKKYDIYQNNNKKKPGNFGKSETVGTKIFFME